MKKQRGSKSNIFRRVLTIVELLFIAFLLIVEPHQFSREPLAKNQVESFLSKNYLPAFYEQADELDFYFLDRTNLLSQIVGKEAICFISGSRFFFWHSSDVYVIREPYVSDQETPNYRSCLGHEIGHAIDNANGQISKTQEFREAVELSIEMLEDDRIKSRGWGFITEQIIAVFPGINGNPLKQYSGGEWGGYEELYADLFDYGLSLELLPPPLRPFYQDYLP